MQDSCISFSGSSFVLIVISFCFLLLVPCLCWTYPCTENSQLFPWRGCSADRISLHPSLDADLFFAMRDVYQRWSGHWFGAEVILSSHLGLVSVFSPIRCKLKRDFGRPVILLNCRLISATRQLIWQLYNYCCSSSFFFFLLCTERAGMHVEHLQINWFIE